MASKVFSTPELLEKIFLHLPLPSLLFAQRVCQTWKMTILTSRKLQQALFLQPLPSSTEPIFNPLIRALFPPLFYPFGGAHDVPALTYEMPCLYWCHTKDGADRLDAVLQKEASWRKMYLVQPPASISKIEVNSTCDCSWQPCMSVLKGEKDTQRMGIIYDVVIHLIDWFGTSSVEIKWCMFESEEDKHWKNPVLRNEIEVLGIHWSECYSASFRNLKPFWCQSGGVELLSRDLEWHKVPVGNEYENDCAFANTITIDQDGEEMR